MNDAVADLVFDIFAPKPGADVRFSLMSEVIRLQHRRLLDGPVPLFLPHSSASAGPETVNLFQDLGGLGPEMPVATTAASRLREVREIRLSGLIVARCWVLPFVAVPPSAG